MDRDIMLPKFKCSEYNAYMGLEIVVNLARMLCITYKNKILDQLIALANLNYCTLQRILDESNRLEIYSLKLNCVI